MGPQLYWVIANQDVLNEKLGNAMRNDDDEPWNFDATAGKARLLYCLLKAPLDLTVRLQYETPGDCFFALSDMLKVLGQLVEGDFDVASVENGKVKWTNLVVAELSEDDQATWSELQPARQLLIARLNRRCFSDCFAFLPSAFTLDAEHPDRTRMWNYFDNVFVQSVWACSPMHDFLFLLTGHGNFATAEECARLSHLCEEGAWALGQRFKHASAALTSEKAESEAKRARSLAPVYGARASSSAQGLSVEMRFKTLVGQLRQDTRLIDAFDQYYAGLGDEKASGEKVRRKLLVRKWLSVANAVSPWLCDVLRVALAKTLMSVKCETNFQWLQHLLSDKRLGMGPETLAAYFLIRKAREWVVTGQDVAVKKGKAISDYFAKPMGDRATLKPNGNGEPAEEIGEPKPAGDGTRTDPISLANDDAEPSTTTTTTRTHTAASPDVQGDASAQRSSGRIRSNRLALIVAKEKTPWSDRYSPTDEANPSEYDYPDERADSDDDYDDDE